MNRKCDNKKCLQVNPEFYNNSRAKDGIDPRCKECRKSEAKANRYKNLEKRRQYSRDWRLRNKEKVSEYNKSYLPTYYSENKADIIKQQTKYTTNRRRTVPAVKLANNLRRRLNHALKGMVKSKRTAELLGCSFDDLKMKLEAQFQPGMNWENYGAVWHIDHKKPLAIFDLTDEKQLFEASNYSNLQPMFALENIRKSSAYEAA